MLTSLRVRNFKRLDDVEIELGPAVVFIGPNNSGKTTALQALALWEVGLRKWLERRPVHEAPKKRPGITINRRDLVSVPVPDANLLWRDLRTRAVQRREGKQETRNIRVEITVAGVTADRQWECGFEFDYANEESFYCRPLRVDESGEQRMNVPEDAAGVRVAFLPPMSGLAATEDRLDAGSIHVRIGEGRTAEVLRNLCYQVWTNQNQELWQTLVGQIERLFGVQLDEPVYLKERGQIVMSYRHGDVKLDLASSGRGLQQTLLLLAHLYTHPNCIVLLDEPDAHLEILRQRQIYQLLTDLAEQQGCQVIAASHSEVILEEAADRDILVAFVGKPHRVDDRGKQHLAKSLKAIGFDQYYQAEQTGWVLYVEGATDLAMLRAFAGRLGHGGAVAALERSFVQYTGNQPQKARDHFYGLKEAKPDLVGVALFDALDRELPEGGPLWQMQWSRRALENYLAFPETLLAYAREDGHRDLLRTQAMTNAIEEVRAARHTLGQTDPFDLQTKASDDCLAPIFRIYFRTLNLPNLMQKTDYHTLVRWVPANMIAPEIGSKLDEIARVASLAKPAG